MCQGFVLKVLDSLLPAEIHCTKNVDDRNCLKTVAGKHVLSAVGIKSKQFFPTIPHERGHSQGGGGEYGKYVYMYEVHMFICVKKISDRQPHYCVELSLRYLF